jgi:hypothetical protein
VTSRFVYRFNPACACAFCVNDGANPQPGAPASLGYDEPHIPAPGPREVIETPMAAGRPGEVFEIRRAA